MGKKQDGDKRCPCGTGKKVKNCCQGKKPRTAAYHLDFGEPVRVEAVRANSDGTFSMIVDGEELVPVDSTLVRGYERPKGLKVLTQLPGDQVNHREFLVGHPDIALLKAYDVILAVDTNTAPVGGRQVSATALALLRPSPPQKHADGSETHSGDIKILITAYAIDVPGNPEIPAWIQTIAWLKAHKGYNEAHRYGIVVDSDLGRIPAYNRGELELAPGFKIPKNVKLIFGTDAVGESIPNQMIRVCHRAAIDVLEHTQKGGLPTTL